MNAARFVTVVSLLGVVLTLIAGGAAAADGPGDGPQYGAIGQYGEVWRGGGFDTAAYDGGKYDKALTPGEFLDPVGFAVDTADKTPGGDGTAIYVLDRTSNLPARVTGRTTWRLQKLDDRGNVLGTDRFTLPANASDYEMLGLAVDPGSGSVYSLAVTFNQQVGEAADEILGWSTRPDGSAQLVPATGSDRRHPVGGERQLSHPRSAQHRRAAQLRRRPGD